MVSSGLLDVLVPAFRTRTGIEVQVMPMGTGKALRIAREGNCDVVLVHDPEAEERFVAEGWGAHRRRVMHNDFVLLGPTADPAGVRGATSVVDALETIARTESTFVSRGDDSGTHRKELKLWRAAGLGPAGPWYRSVGKGMGGTLIMASEMRAYILADRGTVIKFRGKIDLAILVEGDQRLHNPYSVIAVNSDAHPHVNQQAALRFIEFLTSDQGQKLIGNYKLDGQVLFHPWPDAHALQTPTEGSGRP